MSLRGLEDTEYEGKDMGWCTCYSIDVYADDDIDVESKTFVGCYIDHNDKHRTRSAEGPEPEWNHTLKW